MRGGARRSKGASLPSRAAIITVLAVSAAPLVAVIFSVEPTRLVNALGEALKEHRTGSAIAFTFFQSIASSFLALAVGLPGAWLYARYRFPGRRGLMALSAVPFCVPPILVILSFVLYFGNAGIVNRTLEAVFGVRPAGTSFLYSFGGIVLVHAFYNFPVIIQIVGGTWSRIPRSREHAARVLGAGSLRAFMTGTLPSLSPAIGQAASLVFLFCFFSFSVVLVFGGLSGSTLEVEVYRRARLESDPAGAAAVAFLETLIALTSVAVFGFFEKMTTQGARNTGVRSELKPPHGVVLAILVGYGLFLAFFFAGPVIALFVQSFTRSSGWDTMSGFGPGNYVRLLSGTNPVLLSALRQTLATAVPAALLATFAGMVLAYARLASVRSGLNSVQYRHRKKQIAEGTDNLYAGVTEIRDSREKSLAGLTLDLAGSLPLAISGVVTAFGWILIFPAGGAGPIILAQATVAFPFVYRGISGAFSSLERGPRLAARSLGASPLSVFLTVDLPAAAPSLAASAAFAFSMAAGDVNAPLMLGSGNFQSLPLLLYRLVGSYRFPEACAAGVVLAILTGTVFFLKERTTDGT